MRAYTTGNATVDHDQRFKTLIRMFFEEFLLLFFQVWADRLDTTAVEWLEKEVFPDAPEGQRHVLDLVAKVRTRQEVAGSRRREPAHWLALVHIEIESPDKIAPLARGCLTPTFISAGSTACPSCRSDSTCAWGWMGSAPTFTRSTSGNFVPFTLNTCTWACRPWMR